MAGVVLIEVGGVARRLGVSRQTVRNLERAGAIPPGMRLESSHRRVWQESDFADEPGRPTPIRSTVRSEEPPTAA